MFGKKEDAFFRGKKQPIISVIEYEGPQDVFVWKHPAEDFNTKSQLIVHESQTAIFFKNGQALDEFSSGRYTLDTQNIPFIRKVVGIATGGESPFHCQVYYINQVVSMGIDWGTDMPISMMDVEYGFPISVTAYGDYSLKVSDGRKFLVKLVGTLNARTTKEEELTYSQDEIKRYFNEILNMHIRNCIASAMENQQIGGMHVNTKLIELAQGIKDMLLPIFDEYGLLLNHFTVSHVGIKGLEEVQQKISKSKLDTIEASGKAGVDRILAESEANRIKVLGGAENEVAYGQGHVEALINQEKGITEAQKLGFEVAGKLAENLGPNVTFKASDGFPGSGFGTGAGPIPVVSSPAGQASEIVKTVMGAGIPAAPQTPAVTEEDLEKKLEKFKDWADKGLISEAEYEEKKKEIIDLMMKL